MVTRYACTNCQFTVELSRGRYSACPKCAHAVTHCIVEGSQMSSVVSLNQRARTDAAQRELEP